MNSFHLAAGRLSALMLAIACSPASEPPVEPAAPVADTESAYVSEIDLWRAERDAGLRRPEGWLSLVGLFWLEEGDNAFGSAEGNAVVFPAGKIEAHAGVLLREGRKVTVLPGAGVALAVEGAPISGATELSLDTSDGGPTIVESGSLVFYAIERGDMIGVRLKDRESPVLTGFAGMEYFPVDESWRLSARYELFDQARTLRTPNVIGTVTEEEIAGEVVFEVGGESYRLLPSGSTESFFLVFGDRTNGVETYGGGRFLYTGPVEADGSVIVDFNKAYSPPCVFTPYATCPLPPAENKLPIRIEAGEKTFGGAH